MANVLGKTCRAILTGQRFTFAMVFFCSMLFAMQPASAQDQYDRDVALNISQSAIGQSLGNYALTSSDNRAVALQDYTGKPILVSMIFTSCHHICPTTTKNLDRAVRAAQEALGDDTFQVVTIGFDSANDTPGAMREFARQQNIAADNWVFLSAPEATIDALSADLGFQYFASARGFDHLNQVSVIDRNGNVYAQIYGMQFELPWLVEPLKQLVFDRPESARHFFAGVLDRVRLFCTVYDPATGRYEFDNSLFFQLATGFTTVLLISLYLWRELRRPRRR